MTDRLPIEMINVGQRLRVADDAQVEALTQSIGEIGLLNPITVYRSKIIHPYTSEDGYGLIAGLNRLTACRKLGMTEIPAHVVEMDELHRQLAECDENLCGTKLSRAERALFTSRRKDIYIALHPETKQGVAGAEAKHGRATANLAFAKDTAAKTGQSERAVQRDAERGGKISAEALAKIKGTGLDTGTYLDRLKKVPPSGQLGAVIKDLAAAKKERRRERRIDLSIARDKQEQADRKQAAFEAAVIVLARLGNDLDAFERLFRKSGAHDFWHALFYAAPRPVRSAAECSLAANNANQVTEPTDEHAETRLEAAFSTYLTIYGSSAGAAMAGRLHNRACEWVDAV